MRFDKRLYIIFTSQNRLHLACRKTIKKNSEKIKDIYLIILGFIKNEKHSQGKGGESKFYIKKYRKIST